LDYHEYLYLKNPVKWCSIYVWNWGYCSKPPTDWAVERMKEIDQTIFSWELWNVRARCFKIVKENYLKRKEVINRAE